MPPLDTVAEDDKSIEFDIVGCYHNLLKLDESLPFPICAISALAEMIARCSSTTIQELLILVNNAEKKLQDACFNPISLTCGTSLLKRFITLQRLEAGMSFREFKSEITERAREFVKGSPRCRSSIVENIQPFLAEGSVRIHYF